MNLNQQLVDFLGIGVTVYNKTLHSYFYPRLPSAIYEDVRSFIDQLVLENYKEDIIYFYNDRYQLNYACLKHGNELLILGPFQTPKSNHEPKEIIRKRKELDPMQLEFLDDFFEELKVIEPSQTKICFEIIFHYQSSDTLVFIDENQFINLEVKDENIEFPDYVEDSYKLEKKLLSYISTGNIMAVHEVLELTKGLNVSHIGNRVLGDPLRNQKNLSLTLNSVSVRAAYDGGLSAKLAHKISTRIAIDIENAKSMYQLNQISKRIFIEYTEAVKEHRSSHYSLHVQHILDYIDTHILNKITVTELSDELHISVEHLSRLFKKEVGKTLSNVIIEKRIIEAKRMIEEGIYTMTEVSNMLHFSSPSHFSKAFKNITHLTPKEYRKKMML